MCSIIIGAAVLGLIIAVMEEDEFPGWGRMVLCVLAAVVPAGLINLFLPPELFFVGLLIGAVLGGLAISALCGMSVKRASIAVAIYFVLQFGISLAFQSIMLL